MKHKNNSQLDEFGFTLVEVMVAVTVLSIGLVGAANVISYNISNSTRAINKTIATNLAQEGVELARNIRDTNWLSGSLWDTNLVQTVGSINQLKFFCGGAVNQNINPAPNDVDVCGNNCRVYTYINTSNNSKCYSDDFGAQAGYNAPVAVDFYRLVKVNRLTADSILVTADIKWMERGNARYLTIQEILYSWR